MSEQMPATAGYHKLTMAGGARYTVVLPAGYTPTSHYTLVLALHYGGPVTPWFGAGLLQALVEPGLRQLNAIIVAPDCAHSSWTNSESEAAVVTLLDHIQASYPIAPDQSLITGYSLGGKGTWYLADQLQHRFQVAIPMASPPMPNALSTNWTIPLYVLHGEKDELFPFAATAAFVQELRVAGVELSFSTIAGASHHSFGGFVQGLAALVPAIQRDWGL